MERTTIYLTCVILLIILLNCCRCDEQSSSDDLQTKKNQTKRYCGSALVRAMRLICDGLYKEPNLKRSLDSGKQFQRNRRNAIWKRRFPHIKDTDLSKF